MGEICVLSVAFYVLHPDSVLAHSWRVEFTSTGEFLKHRAEGNLLFTCSDLIAREVNWTNLEANYKVHLSERYWKAPGQEAGKRRVQGLGAATWEDTLRQLEVVWGLGEGLEVWVDHTKAVSTTDLTWTVEKPLQPLHSHFTFQLSPNPCSLPSNFTAHLLKHSFSLSRDAV
jgi:hypothetical protein